MKRLAITEADYIKAMRRANRELELELHDKQCSLRKSTFKTKKDYSRQKYKHYQDEDY